jgi:hypothetical protein
MFRDLVNLLHDSLFGAWAVQMKLIENTQEDFVQVLLVFAVKFLSVKQVTNPGEALKDFIHTTA